MLRLSWDALILVFCEEAVSRMELVLWTLQPVLYEVW
jgi:hypothetical protein